MPPGSQKRKRPDESAAEEAVTSNSPLPRSKKSRPSTDASQELDSTEADTAERTNRTGGSRSTEFPDEEISGDARTGLYFSRPSWTYVTDNVVSTWSNVGRTKLLTSAAEADGLLVCEIFEELAWSGLSGKLSGHQAGQAVREIIASRKNDGIEPDLLFLNIISLLEEKDHSNPNLRPLVAATGIDPQIMRQELDIPLLQALNLVRSTFDRVRTRKTTNALYRQANFNLLREESEGYAKLITEYFNTAQDASNRREEDPYLAEDAFQRVKALVGAFDLDVGRVLDITLDVSANLLVKAYPFLMKFYRASSWWPDNRSLGRVKWENYGFDPLPSWALPGSGMSTSSDEDKDQLTTFRETRDIQFWQRVRDVGLDAFFEIGSRRILDFDSVVADLESDIPAEFDTKGKETHPEKRSRHNEARKYMRKIRTLPPSGNFDAAQLLGFKLRFYASDARDQSDVLPDNVVYLAALLIKIGFISLRDLYPHLYPADDAMPQEKTRLEKEKAEKEAKERPGAATNALAMAAALTDDTLPVTRPARSEKDRSGGATPAHERKDDVRDDLPPPQNQKIILLKALLLIGALPEALYILGRFPWLVEADVSMPQYFHRIAKHMLSKVADSVRPVVDRPDMQDPSEQLADTLSKGDARLSFVPRPINKKSTRWLHNDGFDEHGQEYRHYYADWSDNIPVCQSIDDVFALCDTLLGYLGVKIGQDAILYGTLLQIAKYSLTEDESTSNRSRWLDLMRRLLVPALSLTKHNPQLTHDLFDILKFYPTATRYNIYAEWFKGRTSRLPDMRVAFVRNRAEVRDVLRRVSNDSGKKQSRALAKVAFSSPGIVMMEMIDQLESYSNMIPSLVECTRYFSHLAHDILTWCLINSLRGEGRDRIQGDGMLTSSWLQALSQFVATLFSRYSHLNPSPVLQYLAWELCRGDSTDLAMFEQLLVEMAGIRSDVEFNDYQVIAMAGGEHLQSHIMQQLSDTRHSKKVPARRLIKALKDPGLIGQILVAIAQETQMYPHHEVSKTMPLKVLGNNMDKIQAVFAQYLEVLRFSLEPSVFEEHVPDTISLIGDFGIEPGVALTICRDAIRSRMEEFDVARKAEEREEKKISDASDQTEPDRDVTMLESATGDSRAEESAPLTSEMQTAEQRPSFTEKANDGPDVLTSTPWHPVLEPVIQRLPDVLPNLPGQVSVPFYVTFWTLTHQDILMPHEVYAKEQGRLKNMIDEIQKDKSDVTSVVARERDRKKNGLADARQNLLIEPKQRMAVFMKVKARLNNKEKSDWFPKPTSDNPKEIKEANDRKHMGLLQECFLPRAMMSALDAHFSFQMLKIMHDNGTPNFSLMHLLFQLFKKQQLTALFFQCTAVEVQNLGRFLNEIMKLLHWWHSDRANYDKEALNFNKLPGFAKKLEPNGEPKTVLEFEEFRRMIFNFHAYLNTALQNCFESGEYMHIRNGIIILKSIHQFFPALKFMGQNMMTLIKKLSNDDPRQDLKLAAMSLLGPLKNREKHWVLPQAFRMSTDSTKDKEAKSDSRAPSAQAETPQNGVGAVKLNGSASEFKPGTVVLSNGTGHRDSVAGREDGEIEDEKQAMAQTESQTISDNTLERTGQHKRQGLDKDATMSEAAKHQPLTPNGREPRSRDNKQSSTAASRATANSNLPSRPSSTQPGNSRPPPTDLPAKLDRPAPGSSTGRNSGRGSARTDDRFGRLERPNEVRSALGEEQHVSQPRTRSPSAAAGRNSYRDDRPHERASLETRPSRDDLLAPSRREPTGHHPRSQREFHDRTNNAARQPEEYVSHERMNRLGSVAILPDQPTSRPSSSGTSNTQSSKPPPESTAHVNPARLQFINEAAPDTQSLRGRRENANYDRDQRRDRDTRPEDRSQTSNFGGRPNGRGLDSQRDPSLRSDTQADLTPTGPKRGRLSHDNAPPQESTYGRLNGPADVPAGPRQHNGSAGRGGRSTVGPASGGHGRPNDQSPQSNYPRTTEPFNATRGGPSRQSSNSNLNPDRAASSSSVPSTPVAEAGPAVHPSRAAQLNQPPPIQTNLSASGASRNSTSSSSAGPPSGPRGTPRGPTSTPTGASPTSNFPPSGPASTAERQRRNDRQRASINATLSSGTNGQGVNFRGASTRQSFDGSYPADSRPVIPTIASSMEPPQGRPSVDGRSFPENASATQPSTRPDLFQEKTNRPDGGNTRRRGDDRQYSSRDASREPRPDNFEPTANFRGSHVPSTDENRARRGHPRDDRPMNDGPTGPSRRGPPRTDEQAYRRPAAETPASFSGAPEWDRGNDSRPTRRDTADEGRRGGRMGGGGRSDDFRGSRREDDRRDPANRGPPRDGEGPPPHPRKRNHEDGNFDPAKRRRGGGGGR